MHFEWDSVKAARNLRKHRVSFMEASTVFYDPLAVTGADPDHSEGEDKNGHLWGVVCRQAFVVSHTERSEAIRIISARCATQYERRIYEEG